MPQLTWSVVPAFRPRPYRGYRVRLTCLARRIRRSRCLGTRSAGHNMPDQAKRVTRSYSQPVSRVSHEPYDCLFRHEKASIMTDAEPAGPVPRPADDVDAGLTAQPGVRSHPADRGPPEPVALVLRVHLHHLRCLRCPRQARSLRRAAATVDNHQAALADVHSGAKLSGPGASIRTPRPLRGFPAGCGQQRRSGAAARARCARACCCGFVRYCSRSRRSSSRALSGLSAVTRIIARTASARATRGTSSAIAAAAAHWVSCR